MTGSPSRSLAAISEALVAEWTSQGFTHLAPWDGELPARALSPSGFFALVAAIPVRWVVRQVVRQPSEARYGRSPVRVVRGTQVRVLEQPAAGDLFERLLRSLDRADLGLGGRELRVREVDWRVRDLGVEGVGWTLSLDGLLVARYLELSTVGGAALAAPAAEITYEVERLALVASPQRSLERLEWAAGESYMALRRREEEELSRHLLEGLDEADCMCRLESELAAAARAMELSLAIPGYEAILRGSQAAEVLRARGAFRTLREARAGERLTALAGGCRELAEAPESVMSVPADHAPGADDGR